MSESYRDLEICKQSMSLFLVVHTLSMRLPKYELYELGSQLRRSASSVNSNIVEGYGRRKYKADYAKFLVYSHASALETQGHLEKLTALYPILAEDFSEVRTKYDELGKMIFRYLQYVEKEWRT
jgi:four helix bundle protein